VGGILGVGGPTDGGEGFDNVDEVQTRSDESERNEVADNDGFGVRIGSSKSLKEHGDGDVGDLRDEERRKEVESALS